MRILSGAYNDEGKADYYNYIRSLDALKASLKGDNKTIILDENSELAKILRGNVLRNRQDKTAAAENSCEAVMP